MAKRKKKNAITMVSLLLVLAALIGVYVWYSNKKSADSSSDASSKISLAKLDTSKVTAVHYKTKNADLNLVLDNGVWKSKEEPDRPISQDNVTSMLKTISKITAYKKLSDSSENLSDYGLDNPSSYIQATRKDGSTVTLKLGSTTVDGKGSYALVNNNKNVYLVDVSYSSGLSFTDSDMTQVAKAPSITAANIYYIKIDNRKGKDVELKENTSGGLDNSGSNLYNWEILQPYGKGYTAVSSNITTLQSNYTSFEYQSCVDYKGTNLGKYGLDKPKASIEISYYKTSSTTSPTPTGTASGNAKKIRKSYKIYVGNQDDNGDYYVMVDGSKEVYTMSQTTVDTMLKVDTFSLLNSYAAIPDLENVDKISVDVKDKTYSMNIKRKTVKKETTASYYFNGTKVKEDSFKKLYETLIAAKYDAQLNKKVDTSKLNPYLTLSFYLSGNNSGTVKVSFLPYNDSFYIADKGNGLYFLVDKRYVDAMAKAIKKFSY